MGYTELRYAVESILFAVGEPVGKNKLAAALGVGTDEIDAAVGLLKNEYDGSERGFDIISIDGGYQMCSRNKYYSYIQDIIGEKRKQSLSNAAMEALAIIAYKQPVTRTIIEKIRGVNSDGAVNRLLERGLIDEVGRLDAPGKPILYGTTNVFLRSFGLSSTEELPPLDTKLQREYERFEQITIDDMIKDDADKPKNNREKDTADTISDILNTDEQ